LIREFLGQQHDDEELTPLIANGVFKPRLQQTKRN
jgi:hypothetical protein